ncbi:MAG: NAD(P)H-dependent oxidoreductase subunit E [Deltaproteobacteria bacterium]|nr:NAD(P)H-dependent oxidoreductase subunit E [Deltaproteobacteria bacterium]
MKQEDKTLIQDICARFNRDRTRMMDVLIEAQRALGYLSSDVIDAIAEALAIARVEVESAASFYAFFSQKPRGKFVIRLCNDIIDKLKGVDRVASALREQLGIDFGQTTDDDLFSLEWTSCIGMCDQAPAALINDKIVTRLSSDSIREIVRSLKEHGDFSKLKLALGSGNNSHPLVRSVVDNNLLQRGAVIFAPSEPSQALGKALAMSPTEVIRSIKTSRLRGRGGAGFPTGMKWEFARNATGDARYVLCNADEGEPGTFKDRVILTEAADLMFEGMTIAGYAIGSEQGILYLRGEYAYLRAFLEDVLAQRRSKGLLGDNVGGKAGFNFDIRIQLGAGAYICGEETALISSCEGLRGDPKTRPPFPAQKGYLDMPSIVNNVETFCCVTRILDKGAGWFAAIGTTGSAGTKLFSVSGDCERPGVYELAFGVTLAELLKIVGAEDAIAVQVGGASGRMVNPSEYGKKLCFDELATGGSIMVFGPGRDVIKVARAFMEFFCEESCGYCTPCRVGNRLLKQGLERFIRGMAEPSDIEYLEQLGKTVKTMSRCGLGQTSANPVLSTLQSFRSEYERRVVKNTSGLQPSFDIVKALRDSETIVKRKSVHVGH